MPPTITDGTDTITFTLFTTIDHNAVSRKFFAQALQRGVGQRVRSPGMWYEGFKFTAVFESIPAGDSGWEQYEDFIEFCKNQHPKYGYQRKLTFIKPGTTSTNRVIQGQAINIAINANYGTDEQKVVFGFDFIPDNISKQVP